MNFNKLAKESHANAVKHGFWEKRESNEHCLMLVVSEIGEMVEAHRTGKRANIEAYNEPLLGGCAPFTSFIKDTLMKMKWRTLQFVLATLPERWAWTLTR